MATVALGEKETVRIIVLMEFGFGEMEADGAIHSDCDPDSGRNCSG